MMMMMMMYDDVWWMMYGQYGHYGIGCVVVLSSEVNDWGGWSSRSVQLVESCPSSSHDRQFQSSAQLHCIHTDKRRFQGPLTHWLTLSLSLSVCLSVCLCLHFRLLSVEFTVHLLCFLNVFKTVIYIYVLHYAIVRLSVVLLKATSLYFTWLEWTW